MKKKIVIVQRRMTEYRVPLFNLLRERLAANNMELVLLYGEPMAHECDKRDQGHLAWAEKLPTKYYFGGRICWQPFRDHLDDAALVIITQENKLVNNHLLLWRPRNFKLAFWGHGRNMQNQNTGLFERFKFFTSTKVDWWFAYTQLTAEIVASTGFNEKKITILNNAIDTREIKKWRNNVSAEDILILRRKLGLGDARIGIFIGSLYKDKRLDFLYEACEKIRGRLHNFHLLVLGDGPERNKVAAWAAKCHWLHWFGSKRNADKAKYLSIADVMLNPGAVGLSILDAFVFKLPLIATRCANHGPEIAYLKNGANGVMTENTVAAYADAALHLLRDDVYLTHLKAEAASAADLYSIENMSENFLQGILMATE